MSRFIIQPSSTQPNHWVLTDAENGVVVKFEDGCFNETQQVTILEDKPEPSPNKWAKIMRELGEWASRHHGSRCFKQPFGFEYSEDDKHLYLYRRNSPKWRLEIEDKTNPTVLAKTLRKAAEFLNKRTNGNKY